MIKQQIVYKNVDDLIPYENNPRDNDEAVDSVAKSIEKFGFKVPIVVDKNYIIVAGHTRLKASKKLGLEKVPVIIADDLNDEKIKAFRLADNKVAEIAVWEEKKLHQELAELEGMLVDMTEFGFDDIEELNEKELENDETPKTMYLDEKDIIAIECDSEEELELTFMKLQEEGYNCRVLTL